MKPSHPNIGPLKEWSTNSHSFRLVKINQEETVGPIEQSKPFLSMLLSGKVLVNNPRKQQVIRPGTFAMYFHGFDREVTALAQNTSWVLFRCPPEYVSRIRAMGTNACDRQDDPRQISRIASLAMRITNSKSDDEAWDTAHEFNELFQNYLDNDSVFQNCCKTAQELRQLLHDRMDQSIGLSATAELMNKNVSHLARTFKKNFGVTVGQYLRSIRCQQALFELGRKDLSLTEIAIATGFADQSHFGRAFKSFCGTTPGEYRKFLRRSWR